MYYFEYGPSCSDMAGFMWGDDSPYGAGSSTAFRCFSAALHVRVPPLPFAAFPATMWCTDAAAQGHGLLRAALSEHHGATD